MGVTGFVLARNEEENIGYCLRSLQWCDELIVIDNMSTDDTPEIAREHGAKVIRKDKEGNTFGGLRQHALDEASNDWIMELDADEICTKPLADRLLEIKNQGDYDCVKIPRKNFSYGRWRFYTIRPNYQMRFFNKDFVHYEDGIHDVTKIDDEAEVLELETREQFYIQHFYAKGLEDRLETINSRSTITADLSDQKFSFFKMTYNIFYNFAFSFGKHMIYKKGYRRPKEAYIETILSVVQPMMVDFKKWQLQDIGTDEDILETYNNIREDFLEEFEKE